MILNDPNNKENPIGCLRFEFYDKNSIGEIIDNAGKKLKDFAVDSVNEIIVTDILNVLEKNKELSYAKMYKCLDPLLGHIKEIGNVKRANLSNKISINKKVGLSEKRRENE